MPTQKEIEQQMANRTYSGETPFSDEDNGDDYTMDGMVVETDAEEIEAENSFKAIPPGDDQQLVVVGFKIPQDSKSRISGKHRDVYINGRKESYYSYTVNVRMALVSDRSRTVVDLIELPPKGPEDQKCWLNGTTNEGDNASQKGITAKKFFQFVERAGFPIEKGKPLPPEVMNLDNWIGRKLVADIVAGKPWKKKVTKHDKDGMKYTEEVEMQGDPKVRFFSYRCHPDTRGQFKRAGEIAAKEQPREQAAAAPPAGEPSQPAKTARPKAGLRNV